MPLVDVAEPIRRALEQVPDHKILRPYIETSSPARDLKTEANALDKLIAKAKDSPREPIPFPSLSSP